MNDILSGQVDLFFESDLDGRAAGAVQNARSRCSRPERAILSAA